MTVMN